MGLFDSEGIVKIDNPAQLNLTDAVLHSQEATVKFENVILEDGVKQRILKNIKFRKNQGKFTSSYKIGELLEKGKGTLLMFIGESGTGKTLCAEAMASVLGMRYAIVNTGNIDTNRVGMYEKNMNNTFAWAQKNNILLVFDECEGMIASRDGDDRWYGSAVHEERITNTLSAIEKFDGVAIFTTNRPFRVDKAMLRRLTDIIEFPFPTKEQQKMIWKNFLMKRRTTKNLVDMDYLNDLRMANVRETVTNMQQATYMGIPIVLSSPSEYNKEFSNRINLNQPVVEYEETDIDIDSILKQYSFAGGMIKQIVMNSLKNATYKERDITKEDILEECKNITSQITNMDDNYIKKSKLNHKEKDVLKALQISRKDLNILRDKIHNIEEESTCVSEMIEKLSSLDGKSRIALNYFIYEQFMKNKQDTKISQQLNSKQDKDRGYIG